MSGFGDLKQDTQGVQQEADRLGGGGIMDTGVYAGVIEVAYKGEAASGAKSLTVHFKADSGQSLRETFYVTSGRDKGGKPYYERDGQKHFLPGFNIANALAALTVGQEITDLGTETKTVSIYNFEAQKELPTDVECFTDLHGKRVQLGIHKVIDDKRKKVGNDYVATGETREFNEVEKVFEDETGLTFAEKLAGETEGKFIKDWADKFTGVVKNKAKGGAATGATAGAPASAGAPAAAPAPAKSLFGNKQ